jgi:fatty-acid peroxygenase
LVPQGGGAHDTGHRCAGEWVTVAVLVAAVRILTREMSYDVPPQDLRAAARRMPTLPASGLRLAAVRARQPVES